MTKIFLATLTGSQETPPVPSAASGSGVVIWDAHTNTATYGFTTRGVDFGPILGLPAQTPAATDDVILVHFHSQARGAAGAVVFAQIDPARGNQDADDLRITLNADGTWTTRGAWEPTDPASTSILNFAAVLNNTPVGADAPLYWNVHTGPFPAGEIRGQLVAFFDTEAYLSANPDVARAGIDPLLHYQLFGFKEGRDPAASFDTTLYLRANPDVAAAGVEPLTHFVTFGRLEGRTAFEAVGRSISQGFDREFYLLANPDVGRAGVDPQQHYNQFGFREGRDPNAFFDTDGYLAAYPDVAAARLNPLAHYFAFGAREGRDPSAEFDTAAYLAANPDVAAAGVNPLQHFLLFGIYEGRSPQSDGVFG